MNDNITLTRLDELEGLRQAIALLDGKSTELVGDITPLFAMVSHAKNALSARFANLLRGGDDPELPGRGWCGGCDTRWTADADGHCAFCSATEDARHL